MKTPTPQRKPWRLQVGPVQLVPVVKRVAGPTRWALPGGASATYAEAVEWARRMGLPAPVMLYQGVTRFPGKRERTA